MGCALQLHSMMRIRTGIMLLGPAACGKTTIIRVLQSALVGPLAAASGANVVLSAAEAVRAATPPNSPAPAASIPVTLYTIFPKVCVDMVFLCAV